MKAILSLFAAAAVVGFAAPSSAKADYPGQTRVVGYTTYGSPIISVYQVVGYDGYGQPIGQWVTQPAQGGYGYSAARPVYVQPNINLGFGVNSGCAPRQVYQHNGHSHHHHGFGR
jgi:hypothetical protein